MKHNFGHFAIDIGEEKPMKVTAVGLHRPKWNGKSPDRRAYMVLVANTGMSLMRLSDPVFVKDHENVTDKELEKMLGVYSKHNRKAIEYRDFLK